MVISCADSTSESNTERMRANVRLYEPIDVKAV